MPYDPQLPWQPNQPENRPPTKYNRQTAYPALSLRKTSSLVFKTLIGVGGIFAALWLASRAFTPAEMRGFWYWLQSMHLGDSRVVSFTLLGLLGFGVIAYMRHTVIRNFGSAAFGYGEAALGLALIFAAFAGWRHGNIWWLTAIGIAWLGYTFVVWGWQNIQANQEPQQSPARQLQPQELPTQTVYGDARNPYPHEIDEALRGKPGSGIEELFED